MPGPRASTTAAWRPVTVPHDWSIEQEFSPEASSGTGYLPGGIGWYRAHVSLDNLGPLSELGSSGGRRVRLVFHGVYKNAQVWVNGYHLGGRPSGYAEFSFDLTELLSYNPGDELVISVRVDHTDISDSRWYNGSGITRRVELEVHEPVRLREPGTTITTLGVDATAAVDADRPRTRERRRRARRRAHRRRAALAGLGPRARRDDHGRTRARRVS